MISVLLMVKKNQLIFGSLFSKSYRMFRFPSCRFGFAEVDVGRMPAWRGTQRFPRLTSLAAAYEYIPTGKVFDVPTALKIGAIDKVKLMRSHDSI